jgi:hypothetical protein
MGRECGTHGIYIYIYIRNAYNILVGKPEGKRPIGRPGRRWENDVRIDLKEISWGGSEWIHLTQDREKWRTVVLSLLPNSDGNRRKSSLNHFSLL